MNHDPAQEELSAALYAREALNYLLNMAERSDAYAARRHWACIAVNWARKEHDRLNQVIEAYAHPPPKISHTPT
jgi:hypothetical protein